MEEKVVGIIGGMGPEATIDLMARVVKATPAMDDGDHIHLVVDNDPKVPSRIKALIEKTGESPLVHLQEMAKKLADWGVNFLAMPCNTAHHYYNDIQKSVQIPILNMIDLSVQHITTQNIGIKTVGILASAAVINLKIYEKCFSKSGIQTLYPEKSIQDNIMQVIRMIKSGKYSKEEIDKIQHAVDYLIQKKHVEAILIACTELSIIAHEIHTSIRCYDSAQILAEAIVKNAKSD